MDEWANRHPETPPERIEVTIERIVPGGPGLGHAEGLTLFVALAAPGDVVRVRIHRLRGKVAFADIEEIIKPSASRIEPPCPYFGACGGCDFQQLTYRAQLDAKAEMIRDCLRRIAHLEAPPEISITPSPDPWHYRSRANWQFDADTKHLGYFEAGSRRVCDVEVCAVLTTELQEVLERVRSEIRDAWTVTLPRDIRAAAGEHNVSVAPPLAGFQTEEVSLTSGGERYWFNANSFFQTNHDLLAGLVAAAIGNAKGKLAIDLYCGAGLFTLPLARRFERVRGVEVSDRATSFARRNLERAQLQNVELVTSDVGRWLQGFGPASGRGRPSRPNARLGTPIRSRLLDHTAALNRDPGRAHSSATVDFLLLDPPRTGAENIVIKGILDLRPSHISYVSCDPATLARDLRKLLDGGYLLESVAAFDMFPQTHHVETVVHLTCES